MDHGRDYRKSHPWITFEFRIGQDRLWCLLGEAVSKCQHEETRAGKLFEVTPEWIKDQNRLILKDIDNEEHVVPGEYTEVRLFAGSYRAAPPQDVEYLVDRLCGWLSELLIPLDDPKTSNDMRFFCSFVAATLAHLYIAWIHPFGDGNGRTARLLECAILAHSGVVPWVSSNLLSDHYNRTRSRYYRQLERASRENDVHGFITYSAQGYVDMLHEQIDRVQIQQRRVVWVNYVHEIMQQTPDGATQKRQRTVVLSLPADRGMRRAEIRRLTPELAEMYAGKTDKTLTRDLNRLHELGLIRRQENLWWSRIDLMDAFLPIARTSS